MYADYSVILAVQYVSFNSLNNLIQCRGLGFNKESLLVLVSLPMSLLCLSVRAYLLHVHVPMYKHVCVSVCEHI